MSLRYLVSGVWPGLLEVTSEAAVILLKKFDEGRNNLEGRDHRRKINIEEKAKVVAAA